MVDWGIEKSGAMAGGTGIPATSVMAPGPGTYCDEFDECMSKRNIDHDVTHEDKCRTYNRKPVKVNFQDPCFLRIGK